jgi:hypothetical protein
MKRITLAPTLVFAFLFLHLVTLQLVSLTTADPIVIQPTPNTNPPSLIIHSPSNTTYYGSDVLLNITVAMPNNWTLLEAVKDVYYRLDGQKHVLWVGTQRNYGDSLNFSTVMKEVIRGQHILQVTVRAQSEYYSDPNRGFASIYSLDTSQTIVFAVAEPFPTAWVATGIVSVAAVSVGLLVYFKKRSQ